jgi:hypothetical protein
MIRRSWFWISSPIAERVLDQMGWDELAEEIDPDEPTAD